MGRSRIELDREISALEGKPKKQFNLNVRYLVSESAADSNLNKEELELVNQMRGAISQSDPLVTDVVKKSLTETCDKGLANRKKVWGALMASERTVFKALSCYAAKPDKIALPLFLIFRSHLITISPSFNNLCSNSDNSSTDLNSRCAIYSFAECQTNSIKL